jgi:hypothetical protein
LPSVLAYDEVFSSCPQPRLGVAASGGGREVRVGVIERERDLDVVLGGLADRLVELRRPLVAGILRVLRVLRVHHRDLAAIQRRHVDAGAERRVGRELRFAFELDRAGDRLLLGYGRVGSRRGQREDEKQREYASDHVGLEHCGRM